MTENPILDVSIGLMLMYLVLSLVCTTINEQLATFLKLRATTLKNALKELIDSDELLDAFNKNGLIAGASKASGGRDPSYLSGRTFALALLGSLGSTKSPANVMDISESLEKLRGTNIHDVLQSQLVTANSDFDKLRDGIATWYDSAMDRVSGVYKRKLKLITIIVAIALAASVNADTIYVAKALWQDPALQLEVVSAANADLDSDDSQLGCGDDGNGSDCAAAALTKLTLFPIGWHGDAVPSSDASTIGSIENWLEKIAGLLLTGIALSLGAPFWFDTLSKFVRIRGVGEKPARTGTETSKVSKVATI